MPDPAAESAIVRGFAPLAGWTKECHLNPISGQNMQRIERSYQFGFGVGKFVKSHVTPYLLMAEKIIGGCVILNNIQMQLQLDLKFGAGFGFD